jgi:murein DD-endopeptidase MepM/ murein hydrolase activator NlpD
VKYLLRFIFFIAMVCLFFVPEAPAEQLIHIVGGGDTIFSLSRFYQVNADELMRVNGITDPSRLQVGRRLVIPVNTPEQTLVDYRVVRGDTLYSLARRHGIALQRLMEINRFSSNHVLRAGDVIRVPGQNIASVPPVPPVNNITAARTTPGGLYALRWPVIPRNISYMTDQLGVVVEGEQFESVKSLTHGNVISAGPWRKFGRVVIVETPGGYYYMYGGCETITVRVGDRVTPGMELGRLGINTVSDRPQLFFMVFRNETPMDPALAPRA